MRRPRREARTAMLRDTAGRQESLEVAANGVHVSNDGGLQAGIMSTARRSSASVLNTSSSTTASDTSSTSSIARKYSLRRSGSNIANLRAAFENNDALETSTIKRFEKSPIRKQDAEIARLEQQLASEIECRQSLQNKLEAEIQHRKTFQEKCEYLERQLESIQAPNKPKDIPDGDMQRQLYELKRSISVATRIEHQVSDSTLTQELSNLSHELQNFMVTSFRRVKLSHPPEELCERLEKIAAPLKQMQYLRPVFEKFEPSMKLAALQTIAVCYIMDIFQSTLLFGLPDQQEWRENLERTVETLPLVLSPPTFNKWRYLTLDAIRQSDSIEESVRLAASNVSGMICAALSAVTGVEDMGARAVSLTPIVMRAVQLSHLFKVQRARYNFHLPISGARFDPHLMEDHAADSDSHVERIVECATFPYVIKHGDEYGDNMQLSNVVAKAQVSCRRSRPNLEDALDG